MLPPRFLFRLVRTPVIMVCIALSCNASPGPADPTAAPAPGPRTDPDRTWPITVDSTRDEFTLIMVPDTQRYTAYFPDILRSQFAWIRDAVGPLEVRYVIHVGDIVEEETVDEWERAEEVFSWIEGVVPFIAVPGNHDLDHEPRRHGIRASTRYNAVFPPLRFAHQAWYGGHRGVTSDNSFGYFQAAGRTFMVMGLEFGADDEALAWADSVLSNSTQPTILVTHCYMYDDDTRLGDGDKWNPHAYNPAWNDGEQIWEKLVQGNDQIFMVLSGHVKGDGTGLLVSTNDAGRPVVQMLANYQHLPHGGNGWLRILKFRPRDGKLDVVTYSPWLDAVREEPDQAFTIDVPWAFSSETE